MYWCSCGWGSSGNQCAAEVGRWNLTDIMSHRQCSSDHGKVRSLARFHIASCWCPTPHSRQNKCPGMGEQRDSASATRNTKWCHRQKRSNAASPHRLPCPAACPPLEDAMTVPAAGCCPALIALPCCLLSPGRRHDSAHRLLPVPIACPAACSPLEDAMTVPAACCCPAPGAVGLLEGRDRQEDRRCVCTQPYFIVLLVLAYPARFHRSSRAVPLGPLRPLALSCPPSRSGTAVAFADRLPRHRLAVHGARKALF